VHLRPLEREGLLSVWDDQQIRPGSLWDSEIRAALESAQVAVLLISADFLASEFIMNDELPNLLAMAKRKGTVIMPVILSSSRFQQVPTLSRFQAVNPPERPLALLPSPRREEWFAKIAREIEAAVSRGNRPIVETKFSKLSHSTSPTRIDEQRFLDSLDDEEYRNALRRLFGVAKSSGMVFEWGSVGASIRIHTPDRQEPLTIAWVFPGNTGWSGLRHVTVGYDSSSAGRTPSVQAALSQYVEAAKLIPGAVRAKARALRAHTFSPEAVSAQQAQLAELLNNVSRAIQEIFEAEHIDSQSRPRPARGKEAAMPIRGRGEAANVTIELPRNDQRVSHQVPMEGTVHDLPPEMQLWIVKEPRPRNYHPDGGPLGSTIRINSNKWYGTAFVGNERRGADEGQSFTIHIVQISSKGARRFVAYLDKAAEAGWPGLRTLYGGIILQTVRVTRYDG
jgi:hypothetical protein